LLAQGFKWRWKIVCKLLKKSFLPMLSQVVAWEPSREITNNDSKSDLHHGRASDFNKDRISPFTQFFRS
jgi:hypothetical protein